MILNSDGSGKTNITPNNFHCTSPSWSPDGNRIAFIANDKSIYIVNSDGTDPVPIFSDSVAIRGLDWSPTDNLIAFSAFGNEEDLEIYTIHSDGSNMTNLTNNNSNEVYPSWSQDGMQIAYNLAADYTSLLYIMNSDGSNQQEIRIEKNY